jgi:hypothetical protein
MVENNIEEDLRLELVVRRVRWLRRNIGCDQFESAEFHGSWWRFKKKKKEMMSQPFEGE